MKGGIILCLVFVVLLIVQPTTGQLYANTSTLLAPPAGNSPKKVVKTVSSYKVFTCANGAWTCSKQYAALVDKSTNKVVGNYTSVVDSEGLRGSWTLINSIGDTYESGHSASVVSGKPLASSNVGKSTGPPAQLFQATSHENEGAAATVSYIQMYNVVGGETPSKAECTTTKHGKTVPFSAEFCLWTQDAVPASVPAELSATGRLVEGFFGEGTMDYKYNGSGWELTARNGTLHNLPGSPDVGQFWMKDGTEGWEVDGPDGFTLYGKESSTQAKITSDSCPWSLSTVTSESDSKSTLGPFSHVQMTSTRGGLPPLLSSVPRTGDVSTVPFSSIYWLYASNSA